MSYIELSGWAFNIIIVLVALFMAWLFIIWPMIEGFSMCRWYAAIGKEYPSVKPTKGWVRLWWSCSEFNGRYYESTSNKYGSWSGVGKWHVNKGEIQP